MEKNIQNQNRLNPVRGREGSQRASASNGINVPETNARPSEERGSTERTGANARPSEERGSTERTGANALWHIFEERKLEVEKSRDKWLRWFVANILLLFLLAVLIFIGLTTSTSFAAASWLEFGVALPLAYSAVFFHAQHSKTREYLEEYSFKTLVARSLDVCRKMIKEDMNGKSAEEEKKYLDFVIGSLKDLHTPPREIISKHPVRDEEDVKVGVVEKLGDIFKKFIPRF